MVQDCTRWYKQRYMIQSGYAALRLDSLLQFCPAIALYWRLQHLITLMQAQACFNPLLPALPPIWLPPLPLLAGGVGSAGFSGGAVDSPRLFFGGRGRERRWRRQRVWAWDHGWVGHGSSLADELARQVLGRWMSPSSGFLEDVVVERSERVAKLCPKFVRGHGIRFST
jgi:hypothetical protein